MSKPGAATDLRHSYIKDHVKSYLGYIFEAIEKYIENLTECSNPHLEFLKITKLEKGEAKTKLMLLLMKYGSKDELINKMRRLRSEVENAENETNKLIEETQQILQKRILLCPKCEGRKRITKVKYIREGTIVTPYFDTTDCSICNGNGSIIIPERFQDCFSITLRALEDIMKLGQICRLTFQEIATF